MHSVVSVLEQIEKIELRAAALYRMWHDRYEHDSEAAFLFYKLYLEEKAHASLARYCKKIILNNRPSFVPQITQPISLAILGKMDEAAKSAKTLKEALNAALEIEIGIGEDYVKSGISEVGDAFVKNTIEVLAEKGHSEHITAFLASRGWKDY